MPRKDDLKTKRAKGDKVMCFRTGCAVLLLSAAVAGAAHAEEAFDAEKTKALFAGTEWVFLHDWHALQVSVTFAKDGKMTSKCKDVFKTAFTGNWYPSGPRKITVGEDTTCEISTDRRKVYVTYPKDRRFIVLYRGKQMPPRDPSTVAILCKPGMIWASVVDGSRMTIAFDADFNAERAAFGLKEGECVQCKVAQHDGYFMEVYLDKDGLSWVDDVGGTGGAGLLLMPDEKGGWVLKNYFHEFRQEPIRPGDALPPQKIRHAASPLSNTVWTTFDGKTGKLRTLSFGANGKANDSAFPSERSEWNHYDNDIVLCKTQGHQRKLTVNINKGRLMIENNDVREVWFLGKTPPRLGLNEAKQLKERLADKSMAWFNWDAGKKTVYVFDDKSGNVTITKEDGKARSVRWDVLCDGCIRIGSEIFMLEGDALERVEPRLTLKQESNL